MHPLPQLLGFLSVRCRNRTLRLCIFFLSCFDIVIPPWTSRMSQILLTFSWPDNTTPLHLLEFFLAQVLDVQGFASLAQNLLLLLSLCLPLATPLFSLLGCAVAWFCLLLFSKVQMPHVWLWRLTKDESSPTVKAKRLAQPQLLVNPSCSTTGGVCHLQEVGEFEFFTIILIYFTI